jgi:rhodanese-related sulfurtransferase
MHRTLRFAIAFAGAIAVVAPALAQQPAAPAWPPIVSQHIAAVRKTIKTTDMAGYLKAVKNPNGAMLVDVREPNEYAGGHVPGAVNIPRGLLEFQIYKAMGYPNKVDTSRTIYVQCRTGGRATLATGDLKKIGFKQPVAVIMNWDDWVKAGNPVEK